MKLKALAATFLSLSLLASSSAAFAATSAAAAAGSSKPAQQTNVSDKDKMEVSQPQPAGTAGAHDIAKQRRHRTVLLWIGGIAVLVAVVAASNSSSSGTTGSTAP